MIFLNPLALLGLAAAAIPLIIHLFNFRRPRKVDFSSLTFLKELQKTTMQRVRIKQWLLLLLRTLAIACLVLAFARPTLQGGLAGTLGGRASSSVAVVIDNSLSMTLRDAQGAYLEQAKALAAGILEGTASGDEIWVVTTAGGSAATTPYQSRGAALDAVGAVEPQIGATTTLRALDRAGTALREAAHLNKEIYLISDLQQSTLVDSLEVGLPEASRLLLLPVGERTYSNVAVTDVRVDSRIIEVGQPVHIQATLVNYGTERVEDYVASIFLEGERVAQATADLAPDAPTDVTFTATPQQRGWLGGTVQIEDDAFEQDNVRYFTLNVPERRRLLLVRGEEQRLDYVQLALSPQLTQGRVAFDIDTVEESALAAKSLGMYDAVVLVGPRTLSSGEAALLSRYVEEGGGLLFFPSAGADAADYNAFFEQVGAGRMSGFSGAAGTGRPIARFDQVDLEHPLFEGIFARPGGAGRPAQVESPDLFFAMNYTPGAGSEQTLIQLSNGFPFLQEIRHGRGALFLMSAAPDLDWSNLPVRGLFIPLLYRSMYYLSASESVTGEQLLVGSGGELRLAGLSEGERLHLVSPQGEEFTPEQRSLFGALLLQIDPAARAPGIYEVRAGDRLVRRIAFNLDSRESDLRLYAPDEAAERLTAATDRPVRVLGVEGGEASRVMQAIQSERMGVELWNVFLLLALIFLVAEMIVARRWRPEAATA